jgi:hypothetical protein
VYVKEKKKKNKKSETGGNHIHYKYIRKEEKEKTKKKKFNRGNVREIKARRERESTTISACGFLYVYYRKARVSVRDGIKGRSNWSLST